MEQYVVKGGVPLRGEVSIGGAKNAALGILAAAIMTDETVTIENVPNVRDTRVLLQAIEGIGAKVKYIYNNTVQINGGSISDLNVEYEYIRKIRASYYLLGALLGKYKESNVALPGGCNIGSRPIDQHLKGFKALGAKVNIDHGVVSAKAENLVGGHIYFDVVTVGATINLMMASCMAEGETILENAAKEPHIVDVANFLNAMGANIKGAGTDVIRIKGVNRLHGCTYSIIPDQIEAGTFMMAAAATRGDIVIKDVIPKHLESITAKLLEMGCKLVEGDDWIRVIAEGEVGSTNVKTLPYPGFPTDMQPQIAVALALAKGSSMVTESIFENRFKYVDELNRMGAKIKVEGNTAYIEGVEKFTSAQLSAPDLRAGAALVIAALAADGILPIDDIENIQRENLNPIEEAMAYKRLLEEFDLKQDEVAERVSKSRTAVTNSMRLLKLSERVQQMIVDDMISTGHARALLALDDEEQQYILANKIFDEKLSVRETEKLVKALKNPKKEVKVQKREHMFVYNNLEEHLKNIIGTKVSVNPKANGKGKIEIEYYSEEELERIYDLIMSIQSK